MANAKLNGERHSYASIDTAPGADGYWSDSVSMSKKRTDVLFLSVSGGGSGTITLQYTLPHDDAGWTDYLTTETLTDGARLRMDDEGHGVKWRAGIKNGAYVSDTVIVGFDW